MDNKKYKVLLVENDKLDQMAFQRLVKTKELPYDCTIAESVSEAQSILRADRFDIVITDYSLGDGTAFDILDLLKDTPVILVTGVGDQEIVVKAWKAGVYDYLIKDHKRNYFNTLPITVENAIKHRQMEETFDRKQKNLEALFDAAPVGMLLVDESMIVKRVNDAIRQLVGREYLQIINLPFGSALGCVNSTYNQKECGYSPACAVCPLRKAVESVLDSEQPVHDFEIQLTLKVEADEIAPWLCISVEPVMIDGRKHAVVAVNDITERKQTEEKLKEAMEMKSQFISTVSHDLRTPLACIKEGVTIVLDGIVGKISDEQRNYLDIAKRNIDRLANLVNDVLDFQKLGTGRVEFNMQKNDITKVVGEVHDTMLSSAKDSGVDISLELEDNLPKARFDRDKIIQVLTNLVSNAIKFTPKHGLVSVSVQYYGEELVIRVNDTGMGIPKEALPRIFERFYCVPRPGKQIQGTGLGLAIVKKIVTMHDGRIEVESEVDKGTIFTIFLPLAGGAMPEAVPEHADGILDDILVKNSFTQSPDPGMSI
ncbi:MAG: response regulator [Planctomycetes bacterium]|nr:response regulator [Planctomycetota bacterium]